MRLLVLASTSPYRKQVLKKLGLEFESRAPKVDETPLTDETPQQLVRRLALMKAKVVAAGYPSALVIGSDQVATFDGIILGKPGTHEKAVEQLSQMSGRKVVFYTGLCLYNSETLKYQLCCVPYTVHFRILSLQQIENYLKAEPAYDSAGSFKSEGLGITLFKKLEGEDPNTLIGLPLIELVNMLEKEQITLPS